MKVVIEFRQPEDLFCNELMHSFNEADKSKTEEMISKYLEGEYLRVELDTETGTATLLEAVI